MIPTQKHLRPAAAIDALGRRASETVSGGPDGPSSTSYSYDLAGNRLTQATTMEGAASSRAYSYEPGTDRLASVSSGDAAFRRVYSHDAAGCVISIVSTGTSHLEPRTSDFGLRTFSWNSLHQLVSVSTNGVVAEFYTWDALGRRASTTTVEGTVFHVYDDNWQCMADLNGQGDVIASYVWGHGIDNLLSVAVAGGDGLVQTYYALTDHQNTVHGFADTNGAVVVRYAYDAWGNLLSEDCSVLTLAANRYRFQGREYSAATGLYNFRARWYDPETGRWLSKDPIGLAGGLNQYACCGNGPANANDPHGTDAAAIALPVFGISFPELGIETSTVAGLEVGAGIGAFGMGFVLGQQLGAYTGLDEFMFDFGADIGNWISQNFAAEHTKNARPSTREKHQKANARRDREQRRAKEHLKKQKKPQKHKKHQGVMIVIPDDDEEDTQPCG